MEIKYVTLDQCCENKLLYLCFEKPRYWWYDCLCVCGHGIMVSLAIVKCDLGSVELIELYTILPHLTLSAAQQTIQVSSAHTAHYQYDEEPLSAMLEPAIEG